MSARRKIGSWGTFANILIVVGVLVIVAINLYGNALHLRAQQSSHIEKQMARPPISSLPDCAETENRSKKLIGNPGSETLIKKPIGNPCVDVAPEMDSKLSQVNPGEKHVLVIGAASFAGSHLVDLLLSLGYDVTAVDNLEAGSDLQFLDLMHDRLQFVYTDPKDVNSLKQVVQKRKVSGAFYVPTGSDMVKEAKAVLDNVTLTRSVERIIMLTMSSQTTPDEQALVSSGPGMFGSGMEVLVMSCYMVYGPRDPLENIYEMASEILHGSGNDFQNFIHVQDVARALVLGYQSKEHGRIIRLDSRGKLADACLSKKLLGFSRTYDFAETMHKMSKAAREGKVDFLPAMWKESIVVGTFEHIMPGWGASEPYERTRRIKVEIGQNNMFLDETLKKIKQMRNCRSTKIMIVVRTAPGNLKERMPRIRTSWGEAPGPNIRIVGFSEGSKDEESNATKDLPPMITSSVCSQKFKDDHGHGMRFCCKTAFALWYASTSSPLMAWDWDWLYLVDDDVYIFLDHLQLKLCSEFSDGRPRVVGLPGCNTKVCQGMCGGGGFGFTRKDLAQYLGEGSQEVFLDEFMRTCKRCEGWDDVSVGMLAHARGMSFGWMPGSEPWELDLESKVDKVVSVHELPTIWHYVREDMSVVHKLHASAGEAMTAKHYIKKKLEDVDLPQVVDHTRKVREAMGLRDKTKTKFKGKKTRLEMYWAKASCTKEHFTIGRFHKAEDCAPNVITSSRCGDTFMFAPGQYDWGCRCCDSVEERKSSGAWNVYRIVEA